jgi:hypothetical protein
MDSGRARQGVDAGSGDLGRHAHAPATTANIYKWTARLDELHEHAGRGISRPYNWPFPAKVKDPALSDAADLSSNKLSTLPLVHVAYQLVQPVAVLFVGIPDQHDALLHQDNRAMDNTIPFSSMAIKPVRRSVLVAMLDSVLQPRSLSARSAVYCTQDRSSRVCTDLGHGRLSCLCSFGGLGPPHPYSRVAYTK